MTHDRMEPSPDPTANRRLKTLVSMLAAREGMPVPPTMEALFILEDRR